MTSIQAPRGFPVVLAADAAEPLRYAAEELKRCFSAMDEDEHPILSCAAGFALWLRVDDALLVPEAFQITVDDKGVVLRGGSPRGVVYGAYALLESAGCRFFAPDCELLPKGAIAFPCRDWTETPAFEGRELFWREAMDGAFAVKLRLNSARSSITPRQGGKLGFYNFSHSFNQLVPVERYFDTHPEYFSMVDGQRRRERPQLCLTSPDVLKLCIAGVREWIEANPQCSIFSVAMNDWYNPCQCPACAAVDREEESGAGTMIRFINALAEEIEKDYPNVFIHTFAYLYCRKPPRRVRPRRNVIVRLCSIECCFSHPIDRCGCQTGGIDVQGGFSRAFHGSASDESAFLRDLDGWSKICDHLYIWDYTTNYANYLQPFPNLSVLSENLRLFKRCGVKGVFEQGNFSHGRCAALGQLKTYLLGRLLWNPDEDAGKLSDEFARGYYGAAAGPMRAYIDLWWNAAGENHAGLYDTPDAPYLTDAILARSEALLKEALTLIDGVYAERVQREALSIRYVRLAQEEPAAQGHGARVSAFAEDARRLGITELFERRNFDESIQALRESRFTADRSAVSPISYPI